MHDTQRSLSTSWIRCVGTCLQSQHLWKRDWKVKSSRPFLGHQHAQSQPGLQKKQNENKMAITLRRAQNKFHLHQKALWCQAACSRLSSFPALPRVIWNSAHYLRSVFFLTRCLPLTFDSSGFLYTVAKLCSLLRLLLEVLLESDWFILWIIPRGNLFP